GLQNAINTHAAACMPVVSENISTEIPIAKEAVNNNHLGVSNGSNKINKIYKYGLIKPPR
ncbi:MAG TPA: hypothetical protein PLC59_06050, partial [Bacteroidales bacterium]|nr:hypothetical protein [Bacteroidales bacterium]